MCCALLDPIEVHTATSHNSKIVVPGTQGDFFFCWKLTKLKFFQRGKLKVVTVEISFFVSSYHITHNYTETIWL
jgi:hypothetical protein